MPVNCRHHAEPALCNAQGGIASLARSVPLAEDSTLATKILAGTRGSAGALSIQVLLIHVHAMHVVLDFFDRESSWWEHWAF